MAACSDPTPTTVLVVPVKPIAAKLVKTPQVDKSAPAPSKPAVKPGKITSVDMGQLFTMSQTGKVYLIDTRPPLYFRLGHIDVANSLPLIKYDKVILEKKPQIEAALKAGKIIVYTVRTSIAQTITNLPPKSQRWVTISQSIAAVGKNGNVQDSSHRKPTFPDRLA